MDQPSAQTDSGEFLISADSHVVELPDLWQERLPKRMRERAPRLYYDEGTASWMFGCPEVPPQAVGALFMAGKRHEELAGVQKAGFSAAREGGWNPVARIKDMEIDGVSGEVLYPSLGLGMFCIEDAELQQACFRIYNDWLIEYCQGAPDRLYGIGLISVYDIDRALAELERCKKAGLRGAMIWQVPHPKLPFTSDHYERLWVAAEDSHMPVSLHILTGLGDSRDRQKFVGLARYRWGVNQTAEIQNALFDLIFSGVFDRHPRLKLVSVENEIGWIPFWIGQCDKYFHRYRPQIPLSIGAPPSEYFRRQVFATFFNDHVGGRLLSWWGVDNCMWSNDYPHQNSTWPKSREVIARDLGSLSLPHRAKLLQANVERLYDLPEVRPGAANSEARPQAL